MGYSDIQVPQTTVDQLNADEIKNHQQLVIDVREDYEWEAGHIDGAIHIPMNELPEKIDDLDIDTTHYIICRTGGRSAQTALWLNSHGFDAVNVSGGMGSWLDNKKPMMSENSQDPTVL